MEDTIIAIGRVGTDEVDPRLSRFRATVRCARCEKSFTFDFNAEEAHIAYAYRAEDIAKDYARRCAPLYCPDCL